MNSSPAPLVDTHCHLNMAAFEKDLESVVNRAREVGIEAIIVPGIDMESSRHAISLAERHSGLYAAVGVHPHHAKEWQPSTRDELRRLAENHHVVAIGEIGLDYYRNYSQAEIQREAFKEQLSLASELELPIVVHNREAMEDILAMLSEWAEDLPATLQARAGVLHAFSATKEAASKAIEMGFYIGIAGPVTFRNAEDLRTIVRQIPLERMLTETDAPYLTPDPHRGKRNEPSYVQFVATTIANTRRVEVRQALEQMAVNARVLFQWNHEITNSHVL